MRSLFLPLLLSALCLPLSACFVDTQGLTTVLRDPCADPEGVPICDESGTQLMICVDGEVSTESCPLGCTPGADFCWVCTPNRARCDGDVVVICSPDGRAEVASATCLAGTCHEDGMGSAECGACTPGTSRCDGASEAVVTCGSTGNEGAPVACAVDEHCEPGDGGTTASCVPNCVEGCDGDDRVTCTPEEVRETCPLGCEMATIECNVLLPSNVGTAIDMDLGTAGLTVGMAAPEHLIFDTDDSGLIDRYDPMTGARTRVRAAVTGMVDAGIYHEQLSATGAETPDGATPPDLAVWVMDSLTVGAMGTIQFVGTRAAVLLVEGDVLVSGRINVRGEWLLDTSGRRVFVSAAAGGSAFVRTPGRGYGGGGRGVSDGGRRAGGGGGSFGSSGGMAGGAGERAVPTAAGPVYGDADLVPLYGGSGGGAGADEIAAGGDGGGAIQISAGGTLTVNADGVIDASGEGGYGARRGGGGGGGAGGGVLLEAAAISIAGSVGAPGGGGGGGVSHGTVNGGLGSRWAPPPQLRGLRGEGRGGFGGRGGHGSSESGGNGEDGQTKHDPNGGGGGGGGGAGRIRLNVRIDGAPMLSGNLVPSGTLSSRGIVSLR